MSNYDRGHDQGGSRPRYYVARVGNRWVAWDSQKQKKAAGTGLYTNRDTAAAKVDELNK